MMISAIVSKRPALDWEILLLAVIGFGLSIAGAAARPPLRRDAHPVFGSPRSPGGLASWAESFSRLLRRQHVCACGNNPRKPSPTGSTHSRSRSSIEPFWRLLPLCCVKAQSKKHKRNGGPVRCARLPAFRGSELVRFFQRNGDAVAAEPRGMTNSQQIDNGYRLQFAYRLASPEGIFDLNLTLTGSEGKNFVGREWQIATDGALTARQRTTYGRLVLELQNEARIFADGWLKAVQSKMTEQVLRGAIAADKQADLDKMLIHKRFAEAILGGLAIAKIDQSLWDKAAFDDLMKRDFFGLGGQELLTNDKRKAFRDVWRLGLFFVAGQSPFRLQGQERVPQMSIDDERVTCQILIDVGLSTTPSLSGTKGKLVLVCDSPEFMNQLRELRTKGKEHPEIADETRAELLTSRPPRHWRVLRLETSLEPAQPQRNAGQ